MQQKILANAMLNALEDKNSSLRIPIESVGGEALISEPKLDPVLKIYCCEFHIRGATEWKQQVYGETALQSVQLALVVIEKSLIPLD